MSLPAGQGDRDARRAARVPEQSPFAYGFLRVVGLSALVPLFRLKTVGRENVPAEGPVVLASLHRSNWDSLAVGVRLERRMRPMAKIELMRAPVLGWILRQGGAFPVRRGETDLQAIASALSILRAGGLLLMFPEGTRNRDGRAEVQPGAARIALQAGAAIVPGGGAEHGSRAALATALPAVPRRLRPAARPLGSRGRAAAHGGGRGDRPLAAGGHRPAPVTRGLRDRSGGVRTLLRRERRAPWRAWCVPR